MPFGLLHAVRDWRADKAAAAAHVPAVCGAMHGL